MSLLFRCRKTKIQLRNFIKYTNRIASQKEESTIIITIILIRDQARKEGTKECIMIQTSSIQKRITIITQGVIITITMIKIKKETTGIRITMVLTKTTMPQEKIKEVTAIIRVITTMMMETIIKIQVETTNPEIKEIRILKTIIPSKMLHPTTTTTTTRFLVTIETTRDPSQTYRKVPEIIITGNRNNNSQNKIRMKLLTNKKIHLKRHRTELM